MALGMTAKDGRNGVWEQGKVSVLLGSMKKSAASGAMANASNANIPKLDNRTPANTWRICRADASLICTRLDPKPISRDQREKDLEKRRHCHKSVVFRGGIRITAMDIPQGDELRTEATNQGPLQCANDLTSAHCYIQSGSIPCAIIL